MFVAYLTMSHRELDRSEVMHRLLERRLSHRRFGLVNLALELVLGLLAAVAGLVAVGVAGWVLDVVEALRR
ncbi:MAG: hypothetical protein IPG81_07555 [Sandaracinaceae bacterium]|nr:hypothetical protein [Sandaracinaceae bacterium]